MNVAETLLAAQLSQAGIPFEREYKFHPDRKWRADFAIFTEHIARDPLHLSDVLVEIEGGIGSTSRHLTYTGFTNDCEKYAAAAILGYRVIRATPRQVDEGDCLEWIRQALGIAV